MNKLKMKITGKAGSPSSDILYHLEEDELGTFWLWHINYFSQGDEGILIGRLHSNTKRGLTVINYLLTGAPLKFFLGRDKFDFEEF